MTTNTNIETILEPISGELSKEHKAMYTGLLDSVNKRIVRGTGFNDSNTAGFVDSTLDLAVQAYWYRRVLDIVADPTETVSASQSDEDEETLDLDGDVLLE